MAEILPTQIFNENEQNNMNFICPYCHETTKTDEKFKFVGNQTYHYKCFNCSVCHEYLGEGTTYFFNKTSTDPDSKLLICNNCKTAVNNKPEAQSNHASSGLNSNMKSTNNNQNNNETAVKGIENGGNYCVKIPKFQQLNTVKCEKCQKTVYETEKYLALGKIWHVNCYRCTTCNSILKDKNGVETVNQKPYCNKCKERAKKSANCAYVKI